MCFNRRSRVSIRVMQFVPCVAVTVAASSTTGCLDLERRGNEFEFGYVWIAQELRDPALCYKIAPDAHSAAALNPRGRQLSLLRSECFFGVAESRHDPKLCDEVRSLSTFWLDGSSISPEACRAAAQTPGRPDLVSPTSVELFLRLLGSPVPDTDNPLGPRFIEEYLGIRRTMDFRERTKRLPDFSRGDAVARQDLLALVPQCRDDRSTGRLCRLITCAVVRGSRAQSACDSNLQPPVYQKPQGHSTVDDP